MKLILHLIRTSRRTVLLSILAGSLCGASTAGLVALINSILNSETPDAQTYLPAFIGLLVALIGLTVWSQVLLVQLAEGSVYELRLQLSRQILATPPALTVGGLFSFMTSLQEASAVLFLSLGGWETIPVGIFSFYIAGSANEAAALGVILIAVAAISVLAINRLAGTRMGGMFG